MSSTPPPKPWVEILNQVEEYRLGNLFRIIKTTLTHRLLNGQMSQPIQRINFERGDGVGVLLYDPEHDVVLLIRQFRYPVYAGLSRDHDDHPRQAWILEIVAGITEDGLSLEETARKELLEEAGYQIKGSLQPITTLYASPGGSSERIALFLGEVDHTQRQGPGGGLQAEGEDIELVSLSFDEAMQMITDGQIRDAKTIVALQHLALQKLRGG